MTIKNEELNKKILGQFSEIQNGGVKVFIRKTLFVLNYILSQLLNILLYLVAYPVIFLEEFLERWINIPHIGEIQTDRLGHFALEPEVILSARDMDPKKEKTKYIFFFGPKPSNLQLKKMWSRVVIINPWAKILHIINSRIPRGKKYIINMGEFSFDTYPLLYPHPHLFFTPEEERIGQQKLREFGIPEGSPFICFHARDPAYLEGRKKEGYCITQDWYYATYRDVNLHNLLPAAEELTKKGYYLIRMGAFVSDPLETNNPKIIDYATKYRTDFMDIYLGAKCSFFLVGETGIASIPMIFRRPVAFDNVIPFGQAQVCQDNYLYIPKKLWLIKEKRQMTISEIFESGAAWFDRRELYDAIGIEIIENTADEIKSLALEMEARLKGTWITQKDDEKLQREFWRLFNPEGTYHREVHKIVNARVSAEYLRQNREFLK